MLLRRKILKLFGLSILFVSLPYQFLKSATKKIINPDLTKTQKDIMFNEGTERPFTSELLKEKRKGFCQNFVRIRPKLDLSETSTDHSPPVESDENYPRKSVESKPRSLLGARGRV